MDLRLLLDILPLFRSGETAATGKGKMGELVEWKTMMVQIMDELKKEPKLMEKLASLLSSPSFDDYLAIRRCLLAHSTVEKMISEYTVKCIVAIGADTSGRKNPAKAASIRLQGNSLFEKKQYGLAFKMFTRGLMFTKDDDEEAPQLYANRAVASFHLKQYENALQDIERALKLGYASLKPAGMLLIRKGFALLALGRDAQVKELLNANYPTNENDPYFSKWQKLKNKSQTVHRQITKRDIAMSQFQDLSTVSTALINSGVFRPHKRFPWLNAKVDLRHNAEKGFHLVSKEELKYGEIVALSKPFVSLDPKRDSYERCHYCMVPCFESPKYFDDKRAILVHELKLSPDSVRMATPLPCPKCSNVLYCSEVCRTAAWTAYHQFECFQMPVLRKLDSQAHLALRMLYMMGSLSENSPNVKLLESGKITNHVALMVDQQAYSFVYPYRIERLLNLEKEIECSLTSIFLSKLAQMSNFLILPKVQKGFPLRLDKVYLRQVSKGLSFLHLHLHRINVDESTPFTDPITDCTVTPSPVQSIDGMTSLLKHSCEATVASSTILRESLESSVKLIYATGDIPPGTVLTLAYDNEVASHTEEHRLFARKYPLYLRYNIKCECTRCLRETRDCLELTTGIYFPIACSLCGELMIRASGQDEGNASLMFDDDSYQCSATDGCNFKYNAAQMKYIYERMDKLMMMKAEITDVPKMMYREFQPKVYQLKTAIESTAQLLYCRSIILAQLYAQLAFDYLLITLVPLSNPDSALFDVDFTPSAHIVDRGHLTTGLLYLNKAFDILESLKQGAGFKTHLAEEFSRLFPFLERTKTNICNLNEELYFDVLPSIEQVQRRYEALQKMTAFDTMLVSSLCD